MTHKLNTPHGPAWFGLAFSCAFAISLQAADASDQNWPQWRGPQQSGVAPSANPPVTWSGTDNIKWKVKIPGEGSATPIVWENQVFIQTAIPTGKKVEATAVEAAGQTPAVRADAPAGQPQNRRGGPGGPGGPGGRGGGGRGFGAKPTEAYQFVIMSLDRATGKVLWQQVAKEEVPHEGYKQNDGTFASNTGVTDGENVIAYFGSRGLYCYDMAGKLQWSQDLGKMRIIMSFGEGSSPALYKNTLVVNWDNEDGSYIIALDKKTGKTLWKEARDEKTSWSTPLIIDQDGKPQVVVTASGKIRAYDLATGKVIWECAGLTRNVIPSPVADNDTIYCMSGYQGTSALAIKRGRTGDLTGSDAILWSYKKNTPYVPSPLLYGGKLYFFSNNNGVLTCLDTKTGQPIVDAQKIESLEGVYASPVGAAGRIYMVGRNGTTVVLSQADKFNVLATNRLDDPIDASPVAVGKELFLRGRGFLYCIAEK